MSGGGGGEWGGGEWGGWWEGDVKGWREGA